MFWAETWKISEFLYENFHFLMVKFSVYLNRYVFVMTNFKNCKNSENPPNCNIHPDIPLFSKYMSYLSLFSQSIVLSTTVFTIYCPVYHCFHNISWKHAYMILTPCKPHFYKVKLGFTGVYIIFLISAWKHRLWVPTIYVLSRNMKDIRILSENFQVLVVKFSIYLNRSVFMIV